MINKTHIVIHHSTSADHPALSNIGAIRNFHVDFNKWRDIGYHFIVEKMQNRYEMVVGRPLTEDGSHCPQMGLNRVGIGVCVVGDFDKEPPSMDLLIFLRRHIRALMSQFNISLGNVIGHGEAQMQAGVKIADRKTCPGLLFDMNGFRLFISNDNPMD